MQATGLDLNHITFLNTLSNAEFFFLLIFAVVMLVEVF
jgi:hypothetical protein